MSKDHRGRSAHANGGATRVKKALFFGGSTPFLWASTKEMGSNGRTSHRPPPSVTAHTYNAKKIKGGTPGEGSPLDPLLRLNKHKRVPRSAERGQGLCPCTPPPLKRRAKLSNALRAAMRERRGGQFRSGGSESTTTASALVRSSFVRAVACSRDLFSQSSTPFMRA